MKGQVKKRSNYTIILLHIVKLFLRIEGSNIKKEIHFKRE